MATYTVNATVIADSTYEQATDEIVEHFTINAQVLKDGVPVGAAVTKMFDPGISNKEIRVELLSALREVIMTDIASDNEAALSVRAQAIENALNLLTYEG